MSPKSLQVLPARRGRAGDVARKIVQARAKSLEHGVAFDLKALARCRPRESVAIQQQTGVRETKRKSRRPVWRACESDRTSSNLQIAGKPCVGVNRRAPDNGVVASRLKNGATAKHRKMTGRGDTEAPA
jgi:hypothetical protein